MSFNAFEHASQFIIIDVLKVPKIQIASACVILTPSVCVSDFVLLQSAPCWWTAIILFVFQILFCFNRPPGGGLRLSCFCFRLYFTSIGPLVVDCDYLVSISDFILLESAPWWWTAIILFVFQILFCFNRPLGGGLRLSCLCFRFCFNRPLVVDCDYLLCV